MILPTGKWLHAERKIATDVFTLNGLHTVYNHIRVERKGDSYTVFTHFDDILIGNVDQSTAGNFVKARLEDRMSALHRAPVRDCYYA